MELHCVALFNAELLFFTVLHFTGIFLVALFFFTVLLCIAVLDFCPSLYFTLLFCDELLFSPFFLMLLFVFSGCSSLSCPAVLF
jgi:hypothetical protein